MSYSLKEIRKHKGLTQKQLALALGISQVYISAIEQGRIGLMYGRICAQADNLDIDLKDLIIDKDQLSSPRTLDITGENFGKLTAIRPTGKTANKNYIWLCQCECGNYTETIVARLKSGNTKSCGCYQQIAASINSVKHGYARSKDKKRIYHTWQNMKKRCNPNSKSKATKDYAKRGIKVCNEWISFEGFLEWALASGYDDTKEIDRIDVDGNYEPSNCRWVDRLSQSNNKRRTIYLTIDGVTKSITDWAEETGLKRRTIYSRYKHYGKQGRELIAPEK